MVRQTNRLRESFNEAAELYHEARPGYPEVLFDDLVSLSGIPDGGRVLEIGCGTGQATAPLARRGYRILCVELGANMAAMARRTLASFPAVDVVTADFEEWPTEAESFDLVTSATALHWIDRSIRYRKIARVLGPGGAVAPFWYAHVHMDADRGFFEEVQGIYERVAPQIVGPTDQVLQRPDDLPAGEVTEIEATGLYGPVTVRRYPFQVQYDTTSYINVLNTYSGHRTLALDVRQRLLDGIAQLMDTQYDGRITKGYLAMLYIAHRS